MNSNIKKSPKSSLSLARSLPHNGCRNKALILQSACQQTVFESCDREELMCEMREKTVKKISNFRWLLNAEKYFTQVISWKMKYFSVIIRSENDSLKKWKENCSSYSKSVNAIKMLFTWSVPCMKLFLSASFNHTKKTQPFSTFFFFLAEDSFNCQHRKKDWILYMLLAFYPSKTFYPPVMPTINMWAFH